MFLGPVFLYLPCRFNAPNRPKRTASLGRHADNRLENWRARRDYSGHPAIHPCGAASASLQRSNSLPANLYSGRHALHPFGAASASLQRSNSLPANLSNSSIFREFEWQLPWFSTSLKRFMTCKTGAPGEIRTPDLLVRSQTLYPTELRAHAFPFPLSRIVPACKGCELSVWGCGLSTKVRIFTRKKAGFATARQFNLQRWPAQVYSQAPMISVCWPPVRAKSSEFWLQFR